jgi:hypothetical protein
MGTEEPGKVHAWPEVPAAVARQGLCSSFTEPGLWRCCRSNGASAHPMVDVSEGPDMTALLCLGSGFDPGHAERSLDLAVSGSRDLG